MQAEKVPLAVCWTPKGFLSIMTKTQGVGSKATGAERFKGRRSTNARASVVLNEYILVAGRAEEAFRGCPKQG